MSSNPPGMLLTNALHAGCNAGSGAGKGYLPMSPEAQPSTGEDGEHISFCRLCEALCGLSVQVQGGRIIRVGPDRDAGPSGAQ